MLDVCCVYARIHSDNVELHILICFLISLTHTSLSDQFCLQRNYALLNMQEDCRIVYSGPGCVFSLFGPSVGFIL